MNAEQFRRASVWLFAMLLVLMVLVGGTVTFSVTSRQNGETQALVTGLRRELQVRTDRVTAQHDLMLAEVRVAVFCANGLRDRCRQARRDVIALRIRKGEEP